MDVVLCVIHKFNLVLNSIGGSIPIAFTLFGEFCRREHRGWYLGILVLFWVSGGIYVSALGWIIIPYTGMVMMQS